MGSAAALHNCIDKSAREDYKKYHNSQERERQRETETERMREPCIILLSDSVPRSTRLTFREQLESVRDNVRLAQVKIPQTSQSETKLSAGNAETKTR